MNESKLASENCTDEKSILSWLKKYIANVLSIEVTSISDTDGLDSLGLDSAITTALAMDLENWLGIEVPLSILFEEDTLENITAGISREFMRQQEVA